MSVGSALIQVFSLATTKQRDLKTTWVRISHRVGARLPASLLSVNIQWNGDLDLVLRCLEDEQAQRIAEDGEAGLFDGHYLSMLSTYWVGSMYEIFRLLDQRKLSEISSAFAEILDDLTLLRMPLEKLEIAKDKKLKHPLQMVRRPPNQDARDLYSYDPKDDTRAHIMPSGLARNGSMSWQIIDVKTNSSRWIERRSISERVINLWAET